MGNVLIFRVGIEGLENKIWREIEIPERRTLADLAYTILASFNSLAYHLYDISYKGNMYHCFEWNDIIGLEPPIDASVTKLSDLELKVNDSMEMDYDTGSTTTFNIVYLGSRELNNYREQELYPLITNGEGLGMLDDISEYELKEIVKDTDKLGYSTHYFTPGYQIYKKYDYRKYNIKKDNRELKGKILAIKNGFEVR